MDPLVTGTGPVLRVGCSGPGGLVTKEEKKQVAYKETGTLTEDPECHLLSGRPYRHESRSCPLDR